MAPYYITAESFGADLPENWEEIARELNEAIDAGGIAEDRDAVEALWDSYWHDWFPGSVEYTESTGEQ